MTCQAKIVTGEPCGQPLFMSKALCAEHGVMALAKDNDQLNTRLEQLRAESDATDTEALTDRQRWALNLATKPTDTEEGTNER